MRSGFKIVFAENVEDFKRPQQVAAVDGSGPCAPRPATVVFAKLPSNNCESLLHTVSIHVLTLLDVLIIKPAAGSGPNYYALILDETVLVTSHEVVTRFSLDYYTC